MALVAHVDHTSLLSCIERNGEVTNLVRLCRVTGIPKGTDYAELMAALAVSDVPAVGHIPVDENGTYLAQLRLVERAPSMSDDGYLDIRLTYLHILDTPCQDLSGVSTVPGASTTLHGKTRTGMQQKTITHDGAGPGQHGTAITVSHDFPDELNAEGEVETPAHTDVQVADTVVMIPEKTFYLEGIVTTDDPVAIEKANRGMINANDWQDEPAGTWLCTEIQYQWVGGRSYIFNFEFQNQPLGWQPTATFIDPKTGRPPENVADTVGHKIIPHYEVVDFANTFKAPTEVYEEQ